MIIHIFLWPCILKKKEINIYGRHPKSCKRWYKKADTRLLQNHYKNTTAHIYLWTLNYSMCRYPKWPQYSSMWLKDTETLLHHDNIGEVQKLDLRNEEKLVVKLNEGKKQHMLSKCIISFTSKFSFYFKSSFHNLIAACQKAEKLITHFPNKK